MRKIAWLTAAVLLLTMLAGCGGDTVAYRREAEDFFTYSMYTTLPEGTAQPTDAQAMWLTDYRVVEENGVLRLYVQDTTGYIAVFDKRAGGLYFSVPPTAKEDTVATEDTRELMQSAVQLTYFDGAVEKSANSFKLGDPEALTCEAIDGGVRVTYVLGDNKRGLEDIPQKLSNARFEELFVNHPNLKENDKKRAKIYYEQDAATGVWTLTDTKNTTLNLLSQILDQVNYTEVDLEKDNEENGLTTQPSGRLSFTVPVEYTLEGESLRTTVPMDKVKYTASKPLLSLCINQYFGAIASQDGAILLPEGTGGLMLFSQAKTDTATYSAGLYGSDDTFTREDSHKADNNNMLPLYGLYAGNNGFLCLIEQGDALATIGAEKANTRTDLNAAWVTFAVRGVIRAVLGDGSLQSDVRIVQDEMYTGSLSYKYSFITGESLSYADLANYYRGYLTARYGLKPTDATAMPLQLYLVGGVRVEKSFLGFQYTGTRVLTDHETAAELCNDLHDKGVGAIRLQYGGILSGGLGEESITSLKLDGALGDEDSLKVLGATPGVSLHLSVPALTVPKDASSFDRYSDTAKTADDSLSKKYRYNMVNLMPEGYEYIVSPLYYATLREELTVFTADNGIKGLSFTDLGRYLYSHNGDSVLFRQDTKALSLAQLKAYSDEHSMVLSNPYMAALPYAAGVVDLPTAQVSKAVDRTVPFYQLAVHGLVEYSGEPMNEAMDYTTALLNCAETGSLPYFKLFAAQPDSLTDTEYAELYSHSLSTWGDRMVAAYTRLAALYARVGNQPMVGHVLLQEGVYRTAYSDGTVVYTNYTAQEVTVEGVTVPAKDFQMEVMA